MMNEIKKKYEAELFGLTVGWTNSHFYETTSF